MFDLSSCNPGEHKRHTKGPINLLPSIPHHTFEENLLWKWVTHVVCGLRWAHVWTFRKLFMPSQVKDASSVNKIAFNSCGCAFTQWHKSIRLAWSRAVPSDHGTDTNSLRVTFATRSFLDNPTREAIRWVDRRGLAPCQECSPARLSFIQSLFQNAKQSSEDNHCHAMTAQHA